MSMFKSVLCLINYSITWTTGSINFGCVGRAVASDIRGPQFESQSSANIFIQNMHLLTTVEKTKNNLAAFHLLQPVNARI